MLRSALCLRSSLSPSLLGSLSPQLAFTSPFAVETFEVEGNTRLFETAVNVFDADGNRLSYASDFAVAAPDKLFGSIGTFNEDGTVNENQTDNYLEFTAPEDGTYYVGLSELLSGIPEAYGEDESYSITSPGLGDNNRATGLGNYEIEIDLLTEDNPRKSGTPTPPVSNPDVTNPLTLSLSANPTTVDSEGNLTNAVVEFVEIDGISGVNFTIRAEGEIPEDGIDEGNETATFTLEPNESYEINQAATKATFAVVDTPDQVAGVSEEIEGNDILSEANALGLSSQNSTVSISGSLSGFGSDEPARFFGFAEDVDFYSVTLEPGQTVTLNIDGDFEIPNNPLTIFPPQREVLQKTDTELRLFDADGNELAANNDGAAPDEELSRDPYLEYTAETAGTYYVGVSQLGNRNYDPNIERSGSGWTFPEVGVFFGDYKLTASLEDGTTTPEEPTTQPIFGSLEADIIEVTRTNQLIFGGDSDDLIDASISSTGNNRIYAGSGDDTAILGMSDRIVGGEGADKFFATSGGDNILTGGAGADQFWIATAETPDAANIITDFTSGEDVLGIAGLGIGFDDLSITQQEDNTLIAANGSDLAILQGIGADSLIVDNFAFG